MIDVVVAVTEAIAGAAFTTGFDSTGLIAACSGTGDGAAGNTAATGGGGVASGWGSTSAGFCAASSATGCVASATPTTGICTVAFAKSVFAKPFFPLPFTKTVKTPGASSTVAVPQRLGVLRPSRRISSTLKLFLRGLLSQSNLLATQTCSQGRFANCPGSLTWPCASVSTSFLKSWSCTSFWS